MVQTLDIQTFINNSNGLLIIDVRTPKEFEHGHIPGAINIPLFSNEERAEIGTLYKQVGRQEAIQKGLERVGPKLASFVEAVKQTKKDNNVYVYCWRGGMRSNSMAWLLNLYGYKTHVLKGGYKSFRNWVLSKFNDDLPYITLGGKTGSSKTYILREMAKKGAQVLDLERYANHKGSAFGHLGEEAQPSQEQFENLTAFNMHQCNTSHPVWVEDESRMIGKKIIPDALWTRMRSSKVIFINIPYEDRIKHLIVDYGSYPKELLKESILRISRRLGPEQTKNSIEALEADDLYTVCDYCLKYYDKTYSYGLTQRDDPKIITIDYDKLNIQHIADDLIKNFKNG